MIFFLLAKYLQETKRYPVLERDEERALALRMRDGDQEAARALVTANLRLVAKIANDYRRAYPNVADLVGEGNLGLLQAVRRYDPDRGARFSTYAAWWIRAYILKFILDNWRLVRIGTTQAQRKLFFRLRKEKEELERQGVAPDRKLLAAKMDVKEREVLEMEQRLGAPDESLDVPAARDEPDGVTKLDLMAADAADRPDTRVEQAEFRAELRARIAEFALTLRGRDKDVFEERWLTDEPPTLEALGQKHGISRERTRQIEKKLLADLRVHLEARLGTAVQIDAVR
jgi:RNA polymerase sigma-32 factor